ncbi:MAG: DEAD/DEAH box helicase, partial [Hyphomicrobiales bacterium]
ALELPTGSGKTLVGLLIGEFRRVTEGKRVLYLCPTNQLVQQVCEQAKRKYAIDARPFVGSIPTYTVSNKSAFQTGEAIAVSTYSALFNTNPFFKNPNLIILDDAHAAENYIAKNWSVVIDRVTHKQIYHGLLDILSCEIAQSQIQRFRSDERGDPNNSRIEKIPLTSQHQLRDIISPFLCEQTENNKLSYPWSLIQDHLHACHIYVGYNSILIRPLVPPTMTHLPFAEAEQRVYMSATLGLGGDLERITGVKKIHRLPIPRGWDRQGIGRRFFVFPELSLPKAQVNSLVKQFADLAGRTLVLVPSEKMAEKYLKLFKDRETFNAQSIESSKDKFVESESGVAILANRYDGIDLSDEDCRLLIIEGLPKAGNLQELFFQSRLASSIVLHDRIRTRIVQAVGRCTRNATDYAAVCVIGDDFSDWLIINEKRSLFHPELQGELKSGAEQSGDFTANDLLENLKLFLKHGEEWREVESQIRDHRNESEQLPFPGQKELMSTVAFEVDYQYSLWNGDYEKCAALAQKICSMLGGDELKGFRGLWYYLAASACENAHKELGRSEYESTALDLYNRASQCLPALGWLRTKSQQAQSNTAANAELDPFLESNIERIEALFDMNSYANPSRFESDAKSIQDGLKQGMSSDAFEESFLRVGAMLGFDALNSSSQAAPDPWWISNDSLCLVSELKSRVDPANPISVTHARQAASHLSWIQEQYSLDENAIRVVMITPAKSVHQEARTFARNVGYWHIDHFRAWVDEVIFVMRNLRSTFSGPGNPAWRDRVRNELLSNALDPTTVIAKATHKTIGNL